MEHRYRTYVVVPILVICFLLVCSGCTSNHAISESNRTTITLATTDSTRLDTEFISSINAGDYPFAVDIINYQELYGNDVNQALIQLNKELAAGDGPDIIDLAAFEFDINAYAEKGLLEDLYPYLENDDTLDKTDIVDGVLQATEYNGMLPGIMSGFTIKTIAVSDEIAQSRTHWSISDFSKYIKNIGSSFLLSEDAIDTETLLYTLNQTTFKSYVDYNTGIVNFNNQEFIDLLHACIPSNPISDNSIYARIVSVGGFMEHQVLENSLGKNMIYIGFPMLDGNENRSYINNQENFLAICYSSKHKDYCWDLIHCFLSEEYQKSKYIKPIETSFPTNKAVLESLANYSMSRIYDENNVEITERGMYGSTYQPAEQSSVTTILDLIASIQSSQRYDPSALVVLMNEEINSFLSGTQSAEATAQNLQTRISTLVSEYK